MNKNDKTTLAIFIVLAILAAYMFYRWNKSRVILNSMQPGSKERRGADPTIRNELAVQYFNQTGGMVAPPPAPGGVNIPAGPIVQPQSSPFLGSR